MDTNPCLEINTHPYELDSGRHYELVGYMGKSSKLVFESPGKPEEAFIPIYRRKIY